MSAVSGQGLGALDETTGGVFGEALTVEEYVRTYFVDAPILAEIARCESQFRHFSLSGDIVRGKVNRKDIGVMQINEWYHREKAEELGHDLYSLDGNLKYARYLYDNEGTDPWVSSSRCWNPDEHLAKK